MTNDLWLAWATQHYNTDEAGVRKIMTDRAKRGPAARKAKLQKGETYRGGFNNAKTAKEAGDKGRQTRYNKEYNGSLDKEAPLDTQTHPDLPRSRG